MAGPQRTEHEGRDRRSVLTTLVILGGAALSARLARWFFRFFGDQRRGTSLLAAANWSAEEELDHQLDRQAAAIRHAVSASPLDKRVATRLAKDALLVSRGEMSIKEFRQRHRRHYLWKFGDIYLKAQQLSRRTPTQRPGS